MNGPSLSFGAEFTPVQIDPAAVRKVCDETLSAFWRQLEVAVANKGDGAEDLGALIHGHMMATLCMAAATDQTCVTADAVEGVVRMVNQWHANFKLALAAPGGSA